MKYLDRLTEMVKVIIRSLFPEGGLRACDMTLGRGKDTLFLSSIFREVIALDIQDEAINSFQSPDNVKVYKRDHSDLSFLQGEGDIDLIIYNLGYLPGGDESITTKYESTLKSLDGALKLIKDNGYIFISSYLGHDGGLEDNMLRKYLKGLDNKNFTVMIHEYLNRGKNPPVLYIIEKRG